MPREKLASPAPSGAEPSAPHEPVDIAAVPLRHPWRWASAVIVVLLLLWFLNVLVTTDAFEWDVVGQYLFSGVVLEGVVHTLQMTLLCMLVGIVIGMVVAIMRLSPNAVLNKVAHLFQWFFRGTPPLVQLIFWFNLASVFPNLEVSVFGLQLFSVSTNSVMTPFVAALLGLGLSFSAYYSEIVRAGILSVDEGQEDAAAAYGLTRFQAMRHIVLPQAMRVIIPPTGNEAIGMLKFTSLATIVSYSELLQTVSSIYNTTFQTIPLLIVAAVWYLFLTSVLSVGQFFLERRFARGTRRHLREPVMYRFWSNMLNRGQAA